MSRTFDARRLDVAAFAQAGARLAGNELLQNHERLAQEAQGAIDDLVLGWEAQGGRRRAVDGSWQPSIHLQAQARLPLSCQRCLGQVMTPLAVDRHLLFVESEERAAALDDESDDDVLALTPDVDLLPSPRADGCPAAQSRSATRSLRFGLRAKRRLRR